MHIKHFLSSAIILILSAQCAFAQTAKNGNWLSYLGNNAINKKWNIFTDFQFRSYNALDDLQQVLGRVGVGYNLTEANNNVLLGYVYVHTENYTATDTKVGSVENRLFLQFVTRQRFQRVYLQHRYRAEARFLPNDVYKTRLRYQVGLNVPLNKPAMDKGAIYLSASDEIFAHACSPKFDRNRIYGGIGYVISPKLRAEFGFMSQGVELTQRGQIQVAFFNNLPLVKH
jgi:hypothetical protein